MDYITKKKIVEVDRSVGIETVWVHRVRSHSHWVERLNALIKGTGPNMNDCIHNYIKEKMKARMEEKKPNDLPVNVRWKVCEEKKFMALLSDFSLNRTLHEPLCLF